MILGLSVVSTQPIADVTLSDLTCRCVLYMYLYRVSVDRNQNEGLYDYLVDACVLASKMIPWAATFIIDGQRRTTVYCLDLDTMRNSLHSDHEESCSSCVGGF